MGVLSSNGRGARAGRRRAHALALLIVGALGVGAVHAVASGVEATSAAWVDPAYVSGAVNSAIGPGALNGRLGTTGAYIAADTPDAGSAVDLGTTLSGLQPGATKTTTVRLQNTSGATLTVSRGTPTVSSTGGLSGSCALTTSETNAGTTSLGNNGTTTATVTLTVPAGLLPTCWNATGTLVASWWGKLASASWSNPAYFRGDVTLGTWVWYGQAKLSGTNLCLDVVSRGNADGQGVQLYECNQTPAQIWTFNPDGSIKVYQSVGINAPNDHPTPRCLDIPNQSTANDVTMQIWTCGYNGTVLSQANQSWSLVDNGDGTVQIRSALAGTNPAGPRCLDVPSSGAVQGTLVRVAACSQTSRSRSWELSVVATVAY